MIDRFRYDASVSPASHRLFAFLIAALALPMYGHARGYRPNQLPGGVEFDCYMCHFREPFVRLTVFGFDVRDTLLFREDYPEELPDGFFVGPEGNVDWATVARLDSDGDGYTNGEELGDPEGLFVQGDEEPIFAFSRPDLPEDIPCGSGTVEGPEQCDGAAFDGATCADYGFAGGVLACRDDCTVDTAGCNRCGDGVIDPDEECDGPVDAPCPEGLDGRVACVDCRLDRTGCAPPDAALDMGPADASPDATSDAAVDAMLDVMPDGLPDAMPAAMPDAMPDAMSDAIWDATPDAMPDAMPDADTADVGDAGPVVPLDGSSAGPEPTDEPDGCAQRPAGSSGLPWLLIALLLIRRRRC